MPDRRVDSAELSSTVPIYEATLKPTPANVTGMPESIPVLDRHLFNKFFELVARITKGMEEAVRNQLTNDPASWNQPLDIQPPSFVIVNRSQIKKVASEIGLPIDETNQQRIDQADWFCIFKTSPQATGKHLQEILDQTRNIVEEEEESSGLILSPLNGPNDHKPKYDEIWAISMAQYPISSFSKS